MGVSASEDAGNLEVLAWNRGELGPWALEQRVFGERKNQHESWDEGVNLKRVKEKTLVQDTAAKDSGKNLSGKVSIQDRIMIVLTLQFTSVKAPGGRARKAVKGRMMRKRQAMIPYSTGATGPAQPSCFPKNSLDFSTFQIRSLDISLGLAGACATFTPGFLRLVPQTVVPVVPFRQGITFSAYSESFWGFYRLSRDVFVNYYVHFMISNVSYLLLFTLFLSVALVIPLSSSRLSRLSPPHCQRYCNPAAFPEMIGPDGKWRFNTSICELTNVWFGGYIAIVREVEVTNFFLEEMIKRRNRYLVAELEANRYAPWTIQMDALFSSAAQA
ncbi:hypothetical protein DFH09DRAFT_1081776 [Mycena vulgaris]|nr:hypothetical protein DFH09DRAFT_1081776 [Mycena vulgaris]